MLLFEHRKLFKGLSSLGQAYAPLLLNIELLKLAFLKTFLLVLQLKLFKLFLLLPFRGFLSLVPLDILVLDHI